MVKGILNYWLWVWGFSRIVGPLPRAARAQRAEAPYVLEEIGDGRAGKGPLGARDLIVQHAVQGAQPDVTLDAQRAPLDPGNTRIRSV